MQQVEEKKDESTTRQSFLVGTEEEPAEPSIANRFQRFVSAVSGCPFFGISLAVASSFFFSLSSVIVKLLKYLSPSQLAIYRFIGMFLPTLVMISWMKIDWLPQNSVGKILLRGTVGSFALVLRFYAFQNLPLGDAAVIVFSLPAFVTILARIFLRELCSLISIACIVLTFLGILLILRPSFIFGAGDFDYYEGTRLYGAVAAIFSVVFVAVVFVLLRMLKEVHYFAIMFDFSVIGLFFMTIQSAATKSFALPKCDLDILLILGLGFVSFAAQLLFTKALQVEEAGIVSFARSSDVVFAFLWQILFFHEVPNAFTIIGSILVTAAILVLAARKYFPALTGKQEGKGIFKSF